MPNIETTTPTKPCFKKDMWKTHWIKEGASLYRRKKPENIVNGIMKNGPKTTPFCKKENVIRYKNLKGRDRRARERLKKEWVALEIIEYFYG